MNPQLYQAMMQAQSAQDPMVAQQQALGAYHPAQTAPQQPMGQMGMSPTQMQQSALHRKMQDAQQVDSIQNRDHMGVA